MFGWRLQPINLMIVFALGARLYRKWASSSCILIRLVMRLESCSGCDLKRTLMNRASEVIVN